MERRAGDPWVSRPCERAPLSANARAIDLVLGPIARAAPKYPPPWPCVADAEGTAMSLVADHVEANEGSGHAHLNSHNHRAVDNLPEQDLPSHFNNVLSSHDSARYRDTTRLTSSSPTASNESRPIGAQARGRSTEARGSETRKRKRPVVVWYQGHDLRTHDLPALEGAVKEGAPVVAFFTLEHPLEGWTVPQTTCGGAHSRGGSRVGDRGADEPYGPKRSNSHHTAERTVHVATTSATSQNRLPVPTRSNPCGSLQQACAMRFDALQELFPDIPPSPPMGRVQRWYLHHSLGVLKRELAKLNIPLVFCVGYASVVVPAFAQSIDASAVFWTERHKPRRLIVQSHVLSGLRNAGIRGFASTHSELILEPTDVERHTRTKFRDFHSYMSFWFKRLHKTPPRPANPPLVSLEDRARKSGEDVEACVFRLPAELLEYQTVDRLGLLEGIDVDFNDAPGDVDRIGCTAAPASLAAFLNGTRFAHFAEPTVRRDGLMRTSRVTTSRLSPHVRFGEISPRVLFHSIVRAGAIPGTDPDKPALIASRVFLKNICLRDFAYYTLTLNPFALERPIVPEFEAFPWAEDADGTRTLAWRTGTTGYPLVDAAMRQLMLEGWIHNRLRYLVASFYCKYLMLPWHVGAAYLVYALIDGDDACNSLGWQWTVGCNADSAPDSFWVNPVSYTSNGARSRREAAAYIRKYVPELAHLPDDLVFEPWLASAEAASAARTRLVPQAQYRETCVYRPHKLSGRASAFGVFHYPERIVLTREARCRAHGALDVMRRIFHARAITRSIAVTQRIESGDGRILSDTGDDTDTELIDITQEPGLTSSSNDDATMLWVPQKRVTDAARPTSDPSQTQSCTISTLTSLETQAHPNRRSRPEDLGLPPQSRDADAQNCKPAQVATSVTSDMTELPGTNAVEEICGESLHARLVPMPTCEANDEGASTPRGVRRPRSPSPDAAIVPPSHRSKRPRAKSPDHTKRSISVKDLLSPDVAKLDTRLVGDSSAPHRRDESTAYATGHPVGHPTTPSAHEPLVPGIIASTGHESLGEIMNNQSHESVPEPLPPGRRDQSAIEHAPRESREHAIGRTARQVPMQGFDATSLTESDKAVAHQEASSSPHQDQKALSAPTNTVLHSPVRGHPRFEAPRGPIPEANASVSALTSQTAAGHCMPTSAPLTPVYQPAPPPSLTQAPPAFPAAPAHGLPGPETAYTSPHTVPALTPHSVAPPALVPGLAPHSMYPSSVPGAGMGTGTIVSHASHEQNSLGPASQSQRMVGSPHALPPQLVQTGPSSSSIVSHEMLHGPTNRRIVQTPGLATDVGHATSSPFLSPGHLATPFGCPPPRAGNSAFPFYLPSVQFPAAHPFPREPPSHLSSPGAVRPQLPYPVPGFVPLPVTVPLPMHPERPDGVPCTTIGVISPGGPGYGHPGALQMSSPSMGHPGDLSGLSVHRAPSSSFERREIARRMAAMDYENAAYGAKHREQWQAIALHLLKDYEFTEDTDRQTSRDYVRLCVLKDELRSSSRVRITVNHTKELFRILNLVVTGEWDRRGHGGVRGPYVYGIRALSDRSQQGPPRSQRHPRERPRAAPAPQGSCQGGTSSSVP